MLRQDIYLETVALMLVESHSLVSYIIGFIYRQGIMLLCGIMLHCGILLRFGVMLRCGIMLRWC